MESIEELLATHQQGRSFAALGLLLAILGGVAIFASSAATLSIALPFWTLFFSGGVAQLAHALSPRTPKAGWGISCGMLYRLAGGLLVVDPVSDTVGLTAFVAGFFLLMGVLRIMLGLRLEPRLGLWHRGLMWTGSIDFAHGFLISLGWPEISLLMIGIFLGLELVTAGLPPVLLSSAFRRRDSTA